VAVYERVWRRYEGPATPLRWRFLVVTRFALADVFSSRLFTAFYALCFLPSALGLFLVYFANNLSLLRQLGMSPDDIAGGLTLTFFKLLFSWQAIPAFLIALIVSPSLIAADLANDALPLYLSRPIDRKDYVIGKMAVLFLLLSPVTWVSGLLVFWLQAYLRGGGWGLEHYRIGLAYLIGHVAWIMVISLLSLAVSAWVKYKPVAHLALFGVFFILGGFGEAINGVTSSSIGDLFNLLKVIVSVVVHLFGSRTPSGLPVVANWGTLVGTCLISVWLLNRKLRAHEVVR
jgi:ABC-2 type transport system permease protein